MGIVKDIYNLLTEVLERYEEPGIAYIYPDVRFYWGSSLGYEADVEACWEDDCLLLNFSYYDKSSGCYIRRISERLHVTGQGITPPAECLLWPSRTWSRVFVTGQGITPPAEWVEFMDAHFKREE